MIEVDLERPPEPGRLEWWTKRSLILLIAVILAAAYFGNFWRLLLTNLNVSWFLDGGSAPA